MRAGVALLALATLAVGFAAGCGSNPGAAQPLPPVASASSSSARAGEPSPSPTPTPWVASTSGTAAFECRLPVSGSRASLEGSQARGSAGGWVSIPNGPFALDPATTAAAGDPNRSGGWAYDPQVRQWLPTTRAAIAPDGSAYAYVEYIPPGGDQRVHVVDARTGADRTLARGSDLDQPAFLADGLYLVHHLIGTDGGKGLVRLDPATGKASELPVPDLRWGPGWVVLGDAAWGQDVSPSTPAQGPKGSWDRLRRYDLRTGEVSTWYESPGHPAALAGVDVAGRPVLTLTGAGGAPSEVDLLTHPLHLHALWPPGSSVPTVAGSGSDARGTWFLTSDQGVWLLPAGGGAPVQVSALRNFWTFAGGCQ